MLTDEQIRNKAQELNNRTYKFLQAGQHDAADELLFQELKRLLELNQKRDGGYISYSSSPGHSIPQDEWERQQRKEKDGNTT